MAVDFAKLESDLRARFAQDLLAWTAEHGQHCAHIARGRIHEALAFLRNEAAARFEVLVDLCGVDYLRWPTDWPPGARAALPAIVAAPPERFAVVYHLRSVSQLARLRVKTYLPESDPALATACDLWPAANWAEREVFDLYGISFTGHPNLKRILMPDDFTGHPLRKDYPLKGRGERDNFPRYGEASARNEPGGPGLG